MLVLVVLLVVQERQAAPERQVPLVPQDLWGLSEMVEQRDTREIRGLLDHLDCQGQRVQKDQLVQLDRLVLQDQLEPLEWPEIQDYLGLPGRVVQLEWLEPKVQLDLLDLVECWESRAAQVGMVSGA